jgi:prepilin-type N-terminal cleavage/methylation domain-containing protein
MSEPLKTMFYKKESGFTLMEILVALTLMGITITAFIQLFSGSLRTVAKSEDYVYATMKADAAMRDVMERSDLQEGTWSETDSEGYISEVTVTEIEKERFVDLEEYKLFQIDLVLKWMKGDSERSIKLSSLQTVLNE